jgi:hypothetical protein
MKLTKQQAKAHAAAMALIDGGAALSLDQIEQCYRDFHEGATSDQTSAGAYFTPVDMAYDLRMEMPQRGTFVDLCAGTGRLAFFAGGQAATSGNRHDYSRIICVERNPEYVRIGKRLFPDAEWICGDALDPAVRRQIGAVDFAISNPPFGVSGKSDYRAPRYTGPHFELKALDVMALLAPEGWAIVPAMTAPFDSRGYANTPRAIDTSRADQWTSATGLPLNRFASLEPDFYRDEWHGVAPMVDFVGFDCGDGFGTAPFAATHYTSPAATLPAMAQMDLFA